MKVVHINTSSTGGAAKAAINLHEGLLQKGVDSCFLYLNGPDIDVENSFRIKGIFSLVDRVFFKLKLKKHYWEKAEQINVLTKRKDIPFTTSYSDFNILESNHAELINSADIVHLHWVAGVINLTHFFSLINKPVVWTMHDMNPFTGGCHHSFDCDKYIQHCNQCPQLIESSPDIARYEYNIKLKAFLGKNISIIALNEWMHNRSKSGNLFKNFPHFIVQNSINTDCFKFSKTKLDNNNLVIKIGYIATYHSDLKGTDLFIEIVRCFQHNTQIHFEYIGKEFSTEYSNLTFKGNFQNDSEVADFYNDLDLLIVPSKADNSPNVILEALCCGCPVLASGVGGIPELISDINGRIIEKLALEEWKQGISELISNLNRFNRSFIAEDAAKKFDRIIQSERMVSVYESILPNSSSDDF